MSIHETIRTVAASWLRTEDFPGVEFGSVHTEDFGGHRIHTVETAGHTLGSGTLAIVEKPLGTVQSVTFSPRRIAF